MIEKIRSERTPADICFVDGWKTNFATKALADKINEIIEVVNSREALFEAQIFVDCDQAGTCDTTCPPNPKGAPNPFCKRYGGEDNNRSNK